VVGKIQEADLSMAKRQRGSTRPGQRPPTKSATGRTTGRASAATSPAPAPQRPTGTLTDEELAHAAALEARIVDEERQASASLARGRDRRRSAAVELPVRGRSRAVSTLAVVAADEYTYVQRDLRRIAIVFIGIFAILFAAFIVSQIAGIGRVA
jgi:hypothetical protein